MPQQTHKRTYWREHNAEPILAELEASGMSTAAFAREHGVTAAKLHRWRRRLRPPSPMPEFVPIEVAARRLPESDIELLIGDGIRVRVPRGFCGETLVRLLGVLGGEASC